MRSKRRVGVIETPIATSGISGSGEVMSLAVNQARETDLPRVTDVISEAFLNDPTWSWAFPDPTARRHWWTFCIQEALRYPWTFKSEGYETVSVWIPPNGAELSRDAEQRGCDPGWVGGDLRVVQLLPRQREPASVQRHRG